MKKIIQTGLFAGALLLGSQAFGQSVQPTKPADKKAATEAARVRPEPAPVPLTRDAAPKKAPRACSGKRMELKPAILREQEK